MCVCVCACVSVVCVCVHIEQTKSTECKNTMLTATKWRKVKVNYSADLTIATTLSQFVRLAESPPTRGIALLNIHVLEVSPHPLM